jgi:hypothetical protein
MCKVLIKVSVPCMGALTVVENGTETLKARRLGAVDRRVGDNGPAAFEPAGYGVCPPTDYRSAGDAPGGRGRKPDDLSGLPVGWVRRISDATAKTCDGPDAAMGKDCDFHVSPQWRATAGVAGETRN